MTEIIKNFIDAEALGEVLLCYSAFILIATIAGALYLIDKFAKALPILKKRSQRFIKVVKTAIAEYEQQLAEERKAAAKAERIARLAAKEAEMEEEFFSLLEKDVA